MDVRREQALVVGVRLLEYNNNSEAEQPQNYH